MASFSSLPERVEALARLSVACGFMLLLLLLSIVVISVPYFGTIKAPLFLMAIYYWAIYRPTLVPLWMVFLAGLFMDLLGATPLGFNALIFVLTQWFVVGQRRFLMGQNFMMIWVGFTVLCLMSLLLQWLIIGLTQMQWFSIDVLSMSAVFGVVLFPPVCVVLHWTHKILPAPHPAMRFGVKG